MKAAIGIILVAMLGLAGCQSSGSGHSPGAAPAAGTIYHSGLGNFTCTVPQMVNPGAKMRDRFEADSADVSFSDDMGGLLRIESERMPAEMKPRFTGSEGDHTLDDIFDRSIMPQTFAVVSADAAVLQREHVKTAAGPALFLIVSIPHGSTLADAATGAHVDSFRGVLVFYTQGFLYVVQNQEWPSANAIHPSPLAVRAERLLADLQQAVAGMTFQEK